MKNLTGLAYAYTIGCLALADFGTSGQKEEIKSSPDNNV